MLENYLFQSTPPAREATGWGGSAEGLAVFQSTPPAREATIPPLDAALGGLVSIHASRTGGDVSTRWDYDTSGVSIHASRTGGDLPQQLTVGFWIHVSIHASRTGGDFGHQLSEG